MGPELALIAAIIEQIIKHGLPAAMKILQLWLNDGPEPTIEEIRTLRAMVPDTKTYFTGRKGGKIT